MNEHGGLLDRIDARRFDVDDIVDRLNAFAKLSVDEQDSYEMGTWEYAGLDEAQHPLLALCGEAHNDFCVVRDLDGSLQFLFESAPGAGSWAYGPLYRQHISEPEVEAFVGGEDADPPLTRDQLQTLLASLPDDPPEPVWSF